MTTTKITGNAAIEVAESKGLTLSKYADPTEGARSGLSVEEAREIAKEDSSLVYVEIEQSSDSDLELLTLSNGVQVVEYTVDGSSEYEDLAAAVQAQLGVTIDLSSEIEPRSGVLRYAVVG